MDGSDSWSSEQNMVRADQRSEDVDMEVTPSNVVQQKTSSTLANDAVVHKTSDDNASGIPSTNEQNHIKTAPWNLPDNSAARSLAQTRAFKASLRENYDSIRETYINAQGDRIVYEALKPGDMVTFLGAIIRDDMALAPKVQDVVFTLSLDSLMNSGFMQMYGLNPDDPQNSMPEEEILVDTPNARDEGFTIDYIREARKYISGIWKKYHKYSNRLDMDNATQTLLDFYGTQWKKCGNVRTVTLPMPWHTVVAKDGEWFKKYFPKVDTTITYTYTYKGYDYIVVGDDKSPWTEAHEGKITHYKAQNPGDLGQFVSRLHLRGSKLPSTIKTLTFDPSLDSFQQNGLFNCLGFHDAHDPIHAQPLTEVKMQHFAEANKVAEGALGRAAVTIRMVPSLAAHPSPDPYHALDHVLAHMLMDIFSICTNVRAVLVPRAWAECWHEHREHHPLVKWEENAEYNGGIYFGGAEWFCVTVGITPGRMEELLKSVGRWEEGKDIVHRGFD
jgi:hypothetical protein